MIEHAPRRGRCDVGAGYRELKRKRPLASERPKSREETPKEGGGDATPITSPHRNNMPVRRTKFK